MSGVCVFVYVCVVRLCTYVCVCGVYACVRVPKFLFLPSFFSTFLFLPIFNSFSSFPG